MPTRSPAYELPGLEPETNAIFGRVIREFESRPVVVYQPQSSTASPILALTTVATAVPGLTVTMPIPSNAQVQVNTVLDISCDTAAQAAIGELFITYPLSTGTTGAQTMQLVLVPGDGAGGMRATLGQQWQLDLPAIGQYTFQIRARKTIGAGVANITDHSNLMVVVL